MDLLGRARRDHHILVMGDQRVLRAIANLRPFRHVRHRAGLVGGLLEMLEVVQPDAIEGARDQRQLDLHTQQRDASASPRCHSPKGAPITAIETLSPSTMPCESNVAPAAGDLSQRMKCRFAWLFSRGSRVRFPGAGRWPPQAEILAQRLAGIILVKQAAALQLRHHMPDEIGVGARHDGGRDDKSRRSRARRTFPLARPRPPSGRRRSRRGTWPRPEKVTKSRGDWDWSCRNS